MKKSKPAKIQRLATRTATTMPTFAPTEGPVFTVGSEVGKPRIKEIEELEVEELEIEEVEVEGLEVEKLDVVSWNAVFGDALIVTGIDGVEETQMYPVALVPMVH